MPPYRSITVFFLFVLIAGCATAPADKDIRLTILHTNDHHGRFWPNRHGEYGMPARKTLINQLRLQIESEGGHVLLLSGGDINTGVPESDMLDAEPDFKGMAALGYDAMAVGNHEFDNPLSVIRKQQDWAGFPFLSANTYHKASGERVFQPYKMFTFNGVRIAVFGLTTEATAVIGNPDTLEDITFTKTVEEARKLVPELRRQADIVVALTHMGHYPDAKHDINAPGDVSLARAVEGIDLIVGGHSQDPVCMAAENQRLTAYRPGDPCVPDRQNGALIVQAHEWGKYLGRADFVFHHGQLKLRQYQLIPVNLKRKTSVNGTEQRQFVGPEITPAENMLALLQPYQDRGNSALYKTIGRVNGALVGDTDSVRNGYTNLGRLIATALMRAGKADLAIINAGGIRAGIEAGDITVKDLLTVLPFNNTLCYVELSGAELKDYLRTVFAFPKNSGGFPQSAGLVLNREDPSQWRVTGISPRSIRDRETYRLAINNFIARGGDNYPPIHHHPGFVDTGLTDVNVLQAFIQRRESIDAAEFEP